VPVVLLLLDFWPLGRFKEKPAAWLRRLPFTSESAGWTGAGLLAEKIPLLLLSLASCAVTVLAQRSRDTLSTVAPIENITTVIIAYASYCFSMVIPKNLCILYPYVPIQNISLPTIAASSLFLLLASYIVIRNMRRFPWLGAGWLWYICTLVPVIGIIQVGMQSKADRYTYIPLIGIFIIIAWSAHALSKGFYKIKTSTIVLICFSLAGLTHLTRKQVNYWKNSLTLYSHTLKCNPDNYNIQNNLALDYYRIGRIGEAMEHFKACLTSSLQPVYSSADYNLGLIYEKKGELKTAIRHFKFVIQRDSTDPQAYFHLVELFNKTHKDSFAKSYLSKLQPILAKRVCNDQQDWASLLQLSTVLIERDSLNIAINLLTQLEKENLFQWEASYFLGHLWKQKGDFQRAFIHYLESMERCKGVSYEPYLGMGVLLFHKGKLNTAKDLFTRSIHMSPLHPESYYNRASVYFLQNQLDSAILDYRTTLRLSPEITIAHNQLANIFMKKGMRTLAVFHRRQAGMIVSSDKGVILEGKSDFSRFSDAFKK
jgi:tetratricopeptide (TPR) repeat protein